MLRTRPGAYSWAIIVSFISSVVAFFFSPEQAFRRHDGMRNTKQHPEVLKTWSAHLSSWSRAWPGAAAVQQHETVSSPRKRPKFKIWRMVSTECRALLHPRKVQKPRPNLQKWETSCLSWTALYLTYVFTGTLHCEILKNGSQISLCTSHGSQSSAVYTIDAQLVFVSWVITSMHF